VDSSLDDLFAEVVTSFDPRAGRLLPPAKAGRQLGGCLFSPD